MSATSCTNRAEIVGQNRARPVWGQRVLLRCIDFRCATQEVRVAIREKLALLHCPHHKTSWVGCS